MILRLCDTLRFPENYVLTGIAEQYFPRYVNVLLLFYMLFLMGCGIFFIRGMTAEQWIEKKGRSTVGSFLLATVFVWCFISLSQVSVFLYFNF